MAARSAEHRRERVGTIKVEHVDSNEQVEDVVAEEAHRGGRLR